MNSITELHESIGNIYSYEKIDKISYNLKSVNIGYDLLDEDKLQIIIY